MSAFPVDVFRAVADPTRRSLLDLLAQGPQVVKELLAHFDCSQPAISQHLKLLRDAGLVEVIREGRERRYRLEAGRLREVGEWVAHFERFWNERLDALGDLLDEES